MLGAADALEVELFAALASDGGLHSSMFGATNALEVELFAAIRHTAAM